MLNIYVMNISLENRTATNHTKEHTQYTVNSVNSADV